MSVDAPLPDVRSGAQSVSAQRSPYRRLRRYVVGVPVVVIVVAIAGYLLGYELRSYALLTHFADPQANGPLLNWESHPVTSELVEIPTANGPLPARLYVPVGVARPRGMVAVHGIHHLGMEEPRLVNFARAVAGSGLAVLTPQIDALADYHVDGASISNIGDSVVWLDQRLGRGPVSVTGISFAGGLTLVAATDPRYASHFRSLALMGAYDDLARVSRFLATSQEEMPDGTTLPYPAHDYGASVFVYAHLDQFFPAADVPAAHEALRYWLWEQPENARPFLEKLSPPSRAEMEALLTRRIDVVRPRILEVIRAEDAELAAISPYGHMASLKIPVFILHGSADNVIPPAESMWMEKDLPKADVRRVLITGAFSHVDPKKNPPWWDEWKLVDFVAAVLRAAN